MKRFAALLAFAFLATAASHAAEPLVKWRNMAISQADYEAGLQSIPEEHRYEFQTDMKRITQMIENLLIFRTLAAEARKEGMDKDPGTKKEIELFAERLLAVKKLAAFEKSIVFPDFTAAAEDTYKTHPEKFRVPESVEAAHILINIDKHGTPEAAKALAQEVRAKVLAGGDFAALAKEYSEDQGSAARGGNLGRFPRGRMLKTFEDAAFAMKNPGDISELVETSYGYHIIRLIGRQPEKQLAFAEVKDRLMADAKGQYIDQKKAEYISAIKNDKSIVLNKEAIDKLKKDDPRLANHN